MNVILVGYRGSGKSTVGPLAAKRLGYSFVDLDMLISQRAGINVRDIFARDGEAGFRAAEREALGSLRRVKKHVIAAGGGAVIDPENRAMMKRIGKVAWLRAPAAVLWARISHDPTSLTMRPDLTNKGGLSEVERILAEREPIYQMVANHIVDTVSQTPDQIAEAIELWHCANDSER